MRTVEAAETLLAQVARVAGLRGPSHEPGGRYPTAAIAALVSGAALSVALSSYPVLAQDGSSWSPHTLFSTRERPDRNRLVDVNRDGRLDAVVGYEAISRAGKLAWYEQPATATGAWIEHVISASVVGPMSLDVVDMDADGDRDVVVGEHNLADNANARLFVFENVDGQGANWTRHLIYTGNEHHDGARVADIDGDNDLDILAIGWSHNRVILYECLAR